jgi:hypothetical protein
MEEVGQGNRLDVETLQVGMSMPERPWWPSAGCEIMGIVVAKIY